MLIGGLVRRQLISSCVVGVGSLIDGSQNAVWPLALEDEFRRIMKNAVIALFNLPHESDKKLLSFFFFFFFL